MNWKDIKETPEHKHIELETQFLVKGYYQMGNTEGATCYKVLNLCDYFDDATVLFDSPRFFIPTKWCYIED